MRTVMPLISTFLYRGALKSSSCSEVDVSSAKQISNVGYRYATPVVNLIIYCNKNFITFTLNLSIYNTVFCFLLRSQVFQYPKLQNYKHFNSSILLIIYSKILNQELFTSSFPFLFFSPWSESGFTPLHFVWCSISMHTFVLFRGNVTSYNSCGFI